MSWFRSSCLLLAALAAGACTSANSGSGDSDQRGAAPLPQSAGELAELGAEAGHAVDPEAAAILGRAGALLRDVRSFTYHAQLSWSEAGPLGVKLRYGGTLDGVVRRPDRFRVEYVTDRVHKWLWYDGTHLTLLSADHDVYSRIEVPGGSDAALRHARDEHEAVVPLTSLLLSDPVTDMRERLAYGYLVGTAWVDGHRCHHLLFLEDDLHWQAWIDAGEKPLPRQIAITYIDAPGQPEFLATLSDWRFGEEFADELFRARIPQSATEIEWMDGAARDGP
jgi:hypothetical protein